MSAPADYDGAAALPQGAAPQVLPGESSLDFLMAGWLAVLAMMTGLVSVFFLPWRIGSVPFPVSAVVGAAVVFWTIHTTYRLTASIVAAFLPAVLWLVMCGWLTTSVTLGFGLVIGDWRAQVLLGLGALGAAIALGTSWGGHVTKRSRAID